MREAVGEGRSPGRRRPHRDLTRGTRDIYLSVVSQSTNEVTKRLTVVATIFIPLTFVVGVYGVNVSGHAANLPELSLPYAHPGSWREWAWAPVSARLPPSGGVDPIPHVDGSHIYTQVAGFRWT